MPRSKKKTVPLWARLIFGILAALLVGALILWVSLRSPILPLEGGENTETNGEDAPPVLVYPKYVSAQQTPVVLGAKEIFGPEGDYYRNGEDLLCAVGKDDPVLTSPAASVWVFGDCLVYRDALEALHVAVSGREYLCSDVLGDPVAAYTDGDGLLWVFSLRRTKLYLNRVSSSGEKVGYDNHPLSLSADGTLYESIEKLERCGSEDGLFYAEAEGRAFCGRFSALTAENTAVTVTPLPETLQKFLGCYLSEGAAVPLYTVKEDFEHLYFLEKGTETPLALPEGCSAETLTEAYGGNNLLLRFEDGVYLQGEDSFRRLPVEAAHLTALYRNSAGALRALMDDGVLYEITEE